MLIPIGLDSTRLARWPRVSTAIVVLCVLAFLGTSLSDADERADQARREAVRYLRERPYLKMPAALERRLGREPSDGPASPPPGASGGEITREQARLEAMALAWAAAEDATPLRRFSLVPARGAFQPGWITHQFLHGGLLHLVGNLLVFVLLVGPFLEDAWGRCFFAAFYLAGGVVAALAQVPGMDPEVPLLGASGAICACLGAFSLRFAHRRVRLLFTAFYFLYRRQFLVPAWLYAGCLFALDLLGFGLSQGRGQVAYGAHVGGFLFGVAVALAVRATGLEERIAPEGAVRWQGGWS